MRVLLTERWFLDDYASFHLRALDGALHRRLKAQPIAKALYPILTAVDNAMNGCLS